MRLLAIASFALACAGYRSGRRLLLAEDERHETADLAATGGSDYGPPIHLGDDIEWWTGLRRASPERVLGGLGGS